MNNLEIGECLTAVCKQVVWSVSTKNEDVHID